MKKNFFKITLFTVMLMLTGAFFMPSTISEAKDYQALTKKQTKKACKNIKFTYNIDTNQLSVKSYKKMNFFKYKKGNKIKIADKKFFNKHFETDFITNHGAVWVDNKKIKDPLCNTGTTFFAPLYGRKFDISYTEKEKELRYNREIEGGVVQKLTPGWHKIKMRIIYNDDYMSTDASIKLCDNGKLTKYFYYTGKIYVKESVEFSNNYSSQSKNIYACRADNGIFYKNIGFKTESNFNGKLDMKAVFKVDNTHFIKGAGKKCGFASDEECLKFIQENIKEDVILEKTFDMKPFNSYKRNKIYTLKATDFSIYNTVKEKTDYKYEYKNIYTPRGDYVTTTKTRKRIYIDLFWNCIRPEISVKITSKDSGKVFLNKTFTKVNENLKYSEKNGMIPKAFNFADVY